MLSRVPDEEPLVILIVQRLFNPRPIAFASTVVAQQMHYLVFFKFSLGCWPSGLVFIIACIAEVLRLRLEGLSRLPLVQIHVTTLNSITALIVFTP